MSLELHYNVYGCFRPAAADLELATAAVDAGFEGIWTGDHFMPWIDSRPYTHHPIPWFGALMNEIPDVPVGTSVTCPTMRYRPPLLAQALATLDNMYPDRFNLGIGVGEALNEAHFIDGAWPEWQERAGMLIEALEVMNRLWTEDEYITYEGDYYQYDGIKLYTRPKGQIDLHWAAWGPTSCRYAGEYTGNLLTITSPEHIEKRIMPRFQDGLTKAGRSPEAAEVTIEFSTNAGDPDALVDEIRERGEYIPEESELDNPDPRSTQTVANQRLSEMSDDDIVEHYRITTDPEEVITDLERYEEAGVTRVLVGSACGDPYDTIELYEEEIIPHFA